MSYHQGVSCETSVDSTKAQSGSNPEPEATGSARGQLSLHVLRGALSARGRGKLGGAAAISGSSR